MSPISSTYSHKGRGGRRNKNRNREDEELNDEDVGDGIEEPTMDYEGKK